MENVLEETLGSVTKPTRYVGNEWNSVHKSIPHNTKPIMVALAFPDLYEIGMSHLGINILYHLLNEQEGIIAERVYAPWIDMEEKLRSNRISLFSLETHTLLKEFDIIGFSLQHELCYTNILTMLDLAGIPIFAKERDETHPLIIAGGACAFNPEPVCEFIDLFVIGEAEEVILDIIKRFRNLKIQKLKKEEALRELAKIEGVYVPSLYEVEYNNDTIKSIRPKYEDIPSKIKKKMINDMDAVFYPTKPIVPYQSIIHDRAVIEAFRGCTQGCRFCQAGMTTRPMRMRSLNCLRKLIVQLMKNTGWEEISLLALNICDYPDIEQIVLEIVQNYGEKGVRISLPSLRLDNFSFQLAWLISMGARAKPILTFAPEAGTQRLRNIINKKLNEDEILTNIGNAYRAGWDSCKLYFMLGLPEETDEDIKGIIKLVKELKRVGQKMNPRANIRLSISPFVPKPHTPFQWEFQEGIESLQTKQKIILNELRKTEIRWQKPEFSFLEGIFARGDRKLNKVLFCAWKNGARFDAWEETFRFSIWEDAFQKSGVDPSFYLYRKREYDEILPWDHIDPGVSKKFLIDENKKSKDAIITPNCMFEECQKCGVCNQSQYKVKNSKLKVSSHHESLSPFVSLHLPVSVKQRIRITFSKNENLKYISHLDLHRTFTRILRRADIPVSFSQSFHPQPKIIFAMPLSVGMTSDCELCDIFLSERTELDEFGKRLSTHLPCGLVLKKVQEVLLFAPALPNIIKGVKYVVVTKLPSRLNYYNLAKKIEEFLKQKEILVHRKTPKVDKMLNIRPLIENIECRIENGEQGNVNSIFEVFLKVANEYGVRPDEVIKALLGSDIKILETKRTEIQI